MSDDGTQIKKWRLAYPEIDVTEEGLATMAPFPSLFANDLLVYLASKGLDKDALEFVRDMHREMVWVYGNWAKAQRDNNPKLLMLDLLNNATGAEYDATRKFLMDYAKANNIEVAANEKGAPMWLGEMKAAAAANASAVYAPPQSPPDGEGRGN